MDVKIYNDRLAGSDCTDFSGMRDRCWRSGRPPHREAREPREREERSYERSDSSRTSSYSRSSSSYSGTDFSASGCLTTLIVIGFLGYVVMTLAAWVDAGSLCTFNQRSAYWRSYYCGRAQMGYGAFFWSAGKPMPPGWQMENGRPVPAR